MSLNKFTDAEKSLPLGLEGGFKKLIVDELIENNALSSSIYASFAPVIVQNTDVPTTMFGANFFGDTLLPENTLKEGYSFKVSFSGNLQSLSAETLTFTLLLGFGGSLQVVSVLPSPAFGNMGGERWALDYTVVCHKDGLLDKAYTVADFRTSLPSQLSDYSGADFDGTVDFSTPQQINVLATWSNASAGNVLTIQKAVIERLR
jgi:hypothetical protein